MAKESNYEIILIFYFLENVDLAIQRVYNRVEEGGHDIPVDTIERRYYRGLDNFFNIYRLNCDYWVFIDNSNINPILIAEGTNTEIKVLKKNKWKLIEGKYDKKI